MLSTNPTAMPLPCLSCHTAHKVFFDLLLDAPLQLPGSCQGADSAAQQLQGALPADGDGLHWQAAAAGSAAVLRSMRALEVIAKLVRW